MPLPLTNSFLLIKLYFSIPRATVAQSYATFWSGVESPLVEVVTPATAVSTSAPTAATERSTVPPPVIMESKVLKEPDFSRFQSFLEINALSYHPTVTYINT